MNYIHIIKDETLIHCQTCTKSKTIRISKFAKQARASRQGREISLKFPQMRFTKSDLIRNVRTMTDGFLERSIRLVVQELSRKSLVGDG